MRDAVLGRLGNDLDFTTDARPDTIAAILEEGRHRVDTGIAYGTVSARARGHLVEITTFRSDTYDQVSRNPEVVFGDTSTVIWCGAISPSTRWRSRSLARVLASSSTLSTGCRRSLPG